MYKRKGIMNIEDIVFYISDDEFNWHLQLSAKAQWASSNLRITCFFDVFTIVLAAKYEQRLLLTEADMKHKKRSRLLFSFSES